MLIWTYFVLIATFNLLIAICLFGFQTHICDQNNLMVIKNMKIFIVLLHIICTLNEAGVQQGLENGGHRWTFHTYFCIISFCAPHGLQNFNLPRPTVLMLILLQILPNAVCWLGLTAARQIAHCWLFGLPERATSAQHAHNLDRLQTRRISRCVSSWHGANLITTSRRASVKYSWS